MKKFRFRLAPLLKVKEHYERERQKNLAVALKSVYQQQAELEGIHSGRLSTIASQQHKMTGRLTVADLLVYSRYLLKLRRDAVSGREVLGGLHKAVALRRRELLKATRERRIYDELRRKLKERFVREANEAETKESDETALNTYRLKRGKKRQGAPA